MRAAHRVAWELCFGPIPKGMHVLHACDNPPCCKPTHLQLGSHRENMAESALRGRHAHGSRHSRARLTEADVVAVRFAHALSGCSHSRMARALGINPGNAHRLLTRKSWRHV